MDKKNIYEIDEADWDLYVVDCRFNDIKPSMSDYLVWCDEHDMERPEIWDGTVNE